jgi:hypothetical protein
MPTLAECALAGHLFKLDIELGRRRQEERLIYASRRLVDWLRDDLPEVVSDRNLEETPLQQVDSLFEVFVSGDTLQYQHQFWCLSPIDRGVWELKTPDVRIFGWFPAKDCFIGFVADSKHRILEYKLVTGYVGEVVRFRDALPLDGTKFIPGDNPHDVVSAFDYP